MSLTLIAKVNCLTIKDIKNFKVRTSILEGHLRNDAVCSNIIGLREGTSQTDHCEGSICS